MKKLDNVNIHNGIKNPVIKETTDQEEDRTIPSTITILDSPTCLILKAGV